MAHHRVDVGLGCFISTPFLEMHQRVKGKTHLKLLTDNSLIFSIQKKDVSYDLVTVKGPVNHHGGTTQ